MPDFHFTSDWFSRSIPLWEKCLAQFQHKNDVHFLEIGSYEGRSACWLLQNILTHESASITCIDTFTPSVFLQKIHKEERIAHDNPFSQNFDWNIRAIDAVDRVIKLKGCSQTVLRTLPMDYYDCIYIDGSHIAKDVLEDAVLSWALLKEGGLLIFDDYVLDAYTEPQFNPRFAIDAFLSQYEHYCTVLHKSWQVIVQKTAAQVPPIIRPELMYHLKDLLVRDGDTEK